MRGAEYTKLGFFSGDWTGELRALSINPITGNVEANPTTGEPQVVWRAQELLSTQNFNTGREILTIKPSTGRGIPFRWPTTIPSSGETGPTAIDQIQIAALNDSGNEGEARLNYIRGDTSNEGSSGNEYRERTTIIESINAKNVLGDIVNSNPFYVGSPTAGYPFGDYRQFSN